MRPIATNVVRCVVYLCLFDTRVSFAKTVESIKMPFGDRMVCTHGTMCYTETALCQITLTTSWYTAWFCSTVHGLKLFVRCSKPLIQLISYNFFVSSLIAISHENNPWVFREFSWYCGTVKYSWKSHDFPWKQKTMAFLWKFYCAKIRWKPHVFNTFPWPIHGNQAKGNPWISHGLAYMDWATEHSWNQLRAWLVNI